MKSSARPYLVAVALFLALLIRIVPLTYSHFWDETVYLQNARVLIDSRSNYDELFYRPPFLSLLYGLGFALWDSVYVANLVQGLVTSLAVVFVFLFVRPMFGLAAAMFSAFLFAFTPYFVVASHELLSDMPAVALMLGAMWLFDKSDKRCAFLSGVIFALAIQTRFTSLFLLGYFVLDAVFSQKGIRSLAWLLGGSALALTPYLTWAWWHFGAFLFPFVHARKVITLGTAPTAASLYATAILQIFPPSMWLFFSAGVVLPLAQWARCRRVGADQPLFARLAALGAQNGRRAVLLIWGAAFVLYMLSIPHKEVRYLLPVAIPVVIISALGLVDLFRWCARQGRRVKVFGVVLAMSAVALDYSPSMQKLMQPWLDRTEWEEVQIGRYLREVSAPADTIYAAHNFPVFAFYSERRTVSLLPYQGDFDEVWRDVMKQPGFLVYYLPAGIKETHSIYPAFRPDREFIEARPDFRMVRAFPGAIVYRYEPAP